MNDDLGAHGLVGDCVWRAVMAGGTGLRTGRGLTFVMTGRAVDPEVLQVVLMGHLLA